MQIPKAILDIETYARNYSLVFSCVCFASKTKLEKVCTVQMEIIWPLESAIVLPLKLEKPFKEL